MKKTIAIDARLTKASGIGTYLTNLISILIINKKYNVILLGKPSELNHYGVDVICFGSPMYSIAEQIDFVKLIPKCDLFWSPHYNIPWLPIKAKKRLVTIHDVNHLVLKQGFVKGLYAKFALNMATFLSDHVITVSDFSKKEILQNVVLVKDSKVTAIHNGIDTKAFAADQTLRDTDHIRDKYKLPTKYLLYVGNVKPHKNLKVLLEAFERLESDIDLLIVGKKEGFISGESEEGLLSICQRKRNRIFFTGYVDQEDLPSIYQMASVFVFPSLYEGFGFPPLESMAAGVPCVVSNASSLPEVCGDAAIYFDPMNTAELHNALCEVLNGSDQSSLINKGFSNVKRFSWEQSFENHLRIISQLL